MKKIDLKIYGVTTVGPKGQIIVPKECRGDFSVDVGVEFCIAMVDKSAFGIGFEHNLEIEKEKGLKLIEDKGKISIGTKFQFVIPAEIRKCLGINPGNCLVVIGKSTDGLGFIKNDKLEFLLDFIKTSIE